MTNDNYYIFKYNDHNIDVDNVNNIVLDFNKIQRIIPLEDNSIRFTNPCAEIRIHKHYSKETVEYFEQHINAIPKSFECNSRIDKLPIFKTDIPFDFAFRKNKIKVLLDD